MRTALAALSSSAAGKVALSLATIGAAGSIAGLGTFATFTDSATADTPVTTGTVDINLPADGATNRFSVAATNVAPGDTIQRIAHLSNDGSLALASVTLTTTDQASPQTVLTSDTTNGLQLVIDKCTLNWVESGPPYTYTCPDVGGAVTVLASRPVLGSNLSLTGLSSTAAGGVDKLRATLTLPSGADNTFQNKTATIRYTFNATQRAATSR